MEILVKNEIFVKNCHKKNKFRYKIEILVKSEIFKIEILVKNKIFAKKEILVKNEILIKNRNSRKKQRKFG